MQHYKKQLEPLINWTALKFYRDEVTYNKIRRHLEDRDDVISEDDIRNIKLFATVIETEKDTSVKKLRKLFQ